MRAGAIGRNPILSVRPPRILDSKPHRFYEAEEMTRIYAACRRQVNGGAGPQPRSIMAAVYRLLANTGARRGEALALRWRWIGREALKIVSTGEERTKSGLWREIPLSEGAQEALERLRGGTEHVLPRITGPSLSRAFQSVLAAAELDGSLHTLRHTYISHQVRNGVRLRTVQIYAGHAHITTTEQYAYLAPGQVDAAVRALAL